LPLAPTLEQGVIVEEFEKKIESIRRLESEMDLQLVKAEKNKQSVLASAFSGKITNG
jgi:type I restriction enzyme S subunit